jgi:tRNA-2-methylthio-N6-dimethylallyladenosine synthase
MKLYIETFGCQMNFSDSEIVASIMQGDGYEMTNKSEEADVIFLNTCAIRDNAEQRVRGRLKELRSQKKRRPGLRIGVLGCMAERLKEKLLEEEIAVDLIAGPDSYRDLPDMMDRVSTGQKAANIMLSEEETYADLAPIRYDTNGVSAFISIMRGCQNFCAYCVVPFTRGKERSRDPESILDECRKLVEDGYREVTLLGQNVNSYRWRSDEHTLDFPDLLAAVAAITPQLRVRFATSHPKDLSDKLINAIATTPNICNHMHLPAQSGSNRTLKAMNRKYTREWYLERVAALRSAIPDIAISTDLIAGFCGETAGDHLETLSLMRISGFDFAFMFAYSERPGTMAASKLKDDIPEETKKGRLHEIITLQHQLSHESNLKDVGKTFTVLVEGVSKKSDSRLYGRTAQNKVVVFPAMEFKPGDYAEIRITSCTSATLLGEPHPAH